MRSMILLASLAAVALWGPGASVAQAQLSSRFLDRFDVNKDGKISRAKLPEGTLRNMFDRMVTQYKLDPEKTYTREELDKALGLTPAASAPPPRSAGGAANSGRGGGRGGPQPGTSRTTFRGSRDSSGSDRPYRPLVELPEEYRQYDKDGDGQVGLYEWPKNRIDEFLRLDKNDDGFLTVDELRKK